MKKKKISLYKKARANKKIVTSFWILFGFLFLGGIAIANTFISNTGDSTFSSNINMDSGTNITADRINGVLYVQAGNGSDIQTKINQCSYQKCIVEIPEGIYNITSTLLLSSNITLRGRGPQTILYLANAVNDNVINNSDKTNGNSYITISNLRIDGNGASQSDTNLHHGIALKKVSNILIERVTIDNTEGDGISFEGTNAGDNTDIIIRDSFFTNDRASIRTKYVERYSISNNQINSGEFGIFIHTTSSYGVVAGNNVKGGGNMCIAVESNGNRNVVDGNTVKDCGGRGINLESGTGAEGNIISNNLVFNSTAQGIRIYGNKNLVTGNSVQNITASLGIDVAGSNNLINNNIILYTGVEGIRVRANNNFISGNYIYGSGLEASNTYDGISINANNAQYNILSDNFISHYNYSFLKYGIGVSGDANQTNNQFINNRITNYSTDAYNEGTNNSIIDFSTFSDTFYSNGLDIGVQRADVADDLFIENDDGNLALNIQQDGVLSALRYALKVRSTAVQTNSPLVWFEQSGIDSTKEVLKIQQNYGTGEGIVVDMNGNGTGINVVNDGFSHGVHIQGTTFRNTNRYLLLLNDDSTTNTRQAMYLDLEGNGIGIDLDSKATTSQGIRIKDMPSNKSITIETNDKLCMDGSTCSVYISYNGSCIISSNGGCI